MPWTTPTPMTVTLLCFPSPLPRAPRKQEEEGGLPPSKPIPGPKKLQPVRLPPSKYLPCSAIGLLFVNISLLYPLSFLPPQEYKLLDNGNLIIFFTVLALILAECLAQRTFMEEGRHERESGKKGRKEKDQKERICRRGEELIRCSNKSQT